MTERSTEDELAAELAREVVAETAPAELPLFRATSRAFFEDPDRALQQRSKDEMLGFGAETVAFLTPYALAIARPVIALLMSELAKHVQERSADTVVTWVRRLLRRPDKGVIEEGTQPEVPPLSADQLSHVRRLALDKALELDLDEGKAVLLADAVVGQLVLGPA
jgi:hypothetical protein